MKANLSKIEGFVEKRREGRRRRGIRPNSAAARFESLMRSTDIQRVKKYAHLLEDCLRRIFKEQDNGATFGFDSRGLVPFREEIDRGLTPLSGAEVQFLFSGIIGFRGDFFTSFPLKNYEGFTEEEKKARLELKRTLPEWTLDFTKNYLYPEDEKKEEEREVEGDGRTIDQMIAERKEKSEW